MPPRALVVVAALRLAISVYAASADPLPPPPVADDWSTLDRTTITKNPVRNELTMDLPAVDLPAGTVVDQAASVGEFPVNGSIYALHAEIIDEHGQRLPNNLLHHMNVMNPAERELFLPISRRILASGRETGEIRFPWLLVRVSDSRRRAYPGECHGAQSDRGELPRRARPAGAELRAGPPAVAVFRRDPVAVGCRIPGG